ncbi:MAG TPA: STAS domain-containing protein [Candidatus Eisenbacteria bacterium]|nr:STAS domain-containing protein [Candidatus Eisenbacteria bacterium]
MKFALERFEGIQVITIDGNLDGGWENLSLKDRVSQLVADGERKFLIDLGKAHFVNSTGIGVLVACLATARGAGGSLKFCNVGHRIRRSLETTGGGIWESLDVHADRDAALRSFGA